jgi:hypothetical protein
MPLNTMPNIFIRLKILKQSNRETISQHPTKSQHPRPTPHGGSMLHIVALPTGAIVGSTTERMIRIDKTLLAFIFTRKE